MSTEPDYNQPGPPSPRLRACYLRIYALVRAIPRGRVMTYGQIAGLCADVCHGLAPAITVGRAMAASRYYAPDLPWWRVIGQHGTYGVLRKASLSLEQRDRLAAEGIQADNAGRYPLQRYQFTPNMEKAVDG